MVSGSTNFFVIRSDDSTWLDEYMVAPSRKTRSDASGLLPHMHMHDISKINLVFCWHDNHTVPILVKRCQPLSWWSCDHCPMGKHSRHGTSRQMTHPFCPLWQQHC